MVSIRGKILNSLKSGSTGSIILFLIAFILLAYLMPRERKFTSEFQVGSPWKEENLTAPFKFAILKNAVDFQAEKDSVLADLKYFFNFDALIPAIQLNNIDSAFHHKWAEFAVVNFRIASVDEYLNNPAYVAHRQLEDHFVAFIRTLFEKIYIRGIAEIPETNFIINYDAEIILIRGNIAENFILNEMYTPKTAYEFAQDKIREEIDSYNNTVTSKYSGFFKEFEFEQFLTPNVFYDAVASEREKNSKLSEISTTKGLIQQGELIVSKGELITPEIYVILQSLKAAYDDTQGNVNVFLVLLGKLIFIMFTLLLIYIFLYNVRRELLHDTVKIGFILFMIVFMVFIARAYLNIEKKWFYIIPFTILPIILRSFFDERIAVFVHVLTVMIIGVLAPNGYEFIVLNIFAGIVAIFSLTNLYRRSRFFLSALMVVVTYSLVYIGINLINEGSLLNIDTDYFTSFGLNGLFILISFLLIYVLEKTFGFLSDTTLMELSDTNQPLLRNLAEIAPGTFQHSLQVASLSEEAIHNIGGNPLLVRAGALYHDIGKMYDPIYFIENQTSGINPHDNLEFEESARAIINHVAIGWELARKNSLPKSIIDFIRTHHGTSTVQYFYKSYIKKYPELEVDVKKFSYPGPKPFSKEMAVLMMADSVEAASRSLKEFSQQNISDLVEKIIDIQLREGQFTDAPVTFRDIKTVKEVFKNRLRNIYHARISYPG
jgi:putative nucleotidyltransferase with HDIG domain